MQYAPSRDRQWYMYSATDAKSNIRRMFLRALVRQPVSWEDSKVGGLLSESSQGMTLVEQSITNTLQGALDELELAAHDMNGKADHIHMYLCILRAQELESPTQTLLRSTTCTNYHDLSLSNCQKAWFRTVGGIC
jgi:acetyl-CoA carboxylase/biotin carboxylase 1